MSRKLESIFFRQLTFLMKSSFVLAVKWFSGVHTSSNGTYHIREEARRPCPRVCPFSETPPSNSPGSGSNQASSISLRWPMISSFDKVSVSWGISDGTRWSQVCPQGDVNGDTMLVFSFLLVQTQASTRDFLSKWDMLSPTLKKMSTNISGYLFTDLGGSGW